MSLAALSAALLVLPAGIRSMADVVPVPAARPADTGTTATQPRTAPSTVPRSLEDALTTAPAVTPAPPAAARTPTAEELTSVPATLRPLLSGTTETAALTDE